MKKFDVGDDVAFLYTKEGKEVPGMSDEELKRGMESVSALIAPPIRFIDTTMSKILSRRVFSIHIMLEESGHPLGVTYTGTDMNAATAALEEALARMREAKKREEN